MFKKDIQPGPKTKLKSSAQRGIRAKVTETYPLLAPHIDAIIPKKEQLDVVKLTAERATLYALGARPLFYQSSLDGEPLLPHLALVHAYPECFAVVRVDRGAVRFVLSGAALMAPGFTSKGGRLPGGSAAGPVGGGEEGSGGAAAEAEGGDERYAKQPDLAAGSVVVVEAEGKEHACCVGVLKMGTAEIKSVKKGVAVEGGHYLGDGLWRLTLD